jgi:hypothetical protein
MKNFKIACFILLASFFFSCQKEYSVDGALTSAGTWQFNDAAKLFTGNIDSGYIQTTGTTKSISLIGKSTDGQQNFLLHLYATDSFTVGTYKASLFQSDFQYYSQSKNIYQADQFIGEFIVTVTALANNTITGIFSGDAEDSTGAIKPLTLGKFTSRINLSSNGTGGGMGGGTAAGTLGASAGTCTPVTNAGIYTQGIALTAANTVTVQVNVTSPGSYSIATNTVNGVNFSKLGIFSATGTNSVILIGSGTPSLSGVQNFTVTFGGNTCNFPITFLAGTPPPIGDYFPTTTGSFWAYGNTSRPDSFLVTATGRSKTIGSMIYTVFATDTLPASGSTFDSYYRKPGILYYENLATEDFGFDPGTLSIANFEYVFLNDTAKVGDTARSPSFTGKVGTVTYTDYLKTTILAKGPAVSGGKSYPDVIKVKYEYYESSPTSTPAIYLTEERWFAKGIGLIYNSFKGGSGGVTYALGRYKVL